MKVALLALTSFAVFAIATPIIQRADSSTTIEDFNGLREQSRALTAVVNSIGNFVDGIVSGGKVVDGIQGLVDTGATAAQHVASAPQTAFSDAGSVGVFDSTAGLGTEIQDLFAALIQKQFALFVRKTEIASKLTQLGIVLNDINTGLALLIPTQQAAVGRLFAEMGSSLDATKAVYST